MTIHFYSTEWINNNDPNPMKVVKMPFSTLSLNMISLFYSYFGRRDCKVSMLLTIMMMYWKLLICPEMYKVRIYFTNANFRKTNSGTILQYLNACFVGGIQWSRWPLFNHLQLLCYSFLCLTPLNWVWWNIYILWSEVFSGSHISEHWLYHSSSQGYPSHILILYYLLPLCTPFQILIQINLEVERCM